MKLQVGVKVLLKNNDGKYLLLHRSKEKYPDIVDGSWDIIGGRIDVGETLMNNLKREIMEESGLKLVGDPVLVGAQDILRGSEKHVVRLTYVGGEAVGDVVLDDEHDDFKWFSIDEMKELDGLDFYLKEILNNIFN